MRQPCGTQWLGMEGARGTSLWRRHDLLKQKTHSPSSSNATPQYTETCNVPRETRTRVRGSITLSSPTRKHPKRPSIADWTQRHIHARVLDSNGGERGRTHARRKREARSHTAAAEGAQGHHTSWRSGPWLPQRFQRNVTTKRQVWGASEKPAIFCPSTRTVFTWVLTLD